MRRSRRILLMLGAFGLAALLGYLVLWFTAPEHRIGPSAIARIEFGMTEAEVISYLKVSSGNYRTIPLTDDEKLVVAPLQCPESLVWDEDSFANRREVNWITDAGHLRLVFDLDGRVVGRSYLPYHDDETFIDAFRRLLRLQ